MKQSETKRFSSGDIASLEFVEGMHGAENIFLPIDSLSVFVTDLSGMVYRLDRNEAGKLEIQSSLKIGEIALGIVQGKDGSLYINAAQGDDKAWLKSGGAIYRVDTGLANSERISGLIQGINGIALDDNGNLYVTAGNHKFCSPDGAVYLLPYDAEAGSYGSFEILLDDLGSANGIFYSNFYESLLFTETFSKVSSVDLQSRQSSEIFGKTKIVEGFDDLCVDSKGRVWVAEPVRGFLKVYDPAVKSLVRIGIEGLGVASSCMTRIENGKEYIYVTEREVKKKHDGRGIAVFLLDQVL